jgi:hypothetical protein
MCVLHAAISRARRGWRSGAVVDPWLAAGTALYIGSQPTAQLRVTESLITAVSGLLQL